MPLDTHKQGYTPSSWARLPKGKGLNYFVPPPMCGTVQGAEPGTAYNCTCCTKMYSPRLSHTMEGKKSIFRALKAFLFFCGDGEGGKGKMYGSYWHS